MDIGGSYSYCARKVGSFDIPLSLSWTSLRLLSPCRGDHWLKPPLKELGSIADESMDDRGEHMGKEAWPRPELC